MIKIEKDVPFLPYNPGENHNKYRFSEYEIGDSALYPCAKEEKHKLASAASYYGSRNKKKFAYKYLAAEKGVRIWRIA